MALEIERKFLVTSEAWRQGRPVRFAQGYLNRDKDRTVRIRLAGKKAFLTIKGPTVGMTREEFEYEVPTADAEQMMALCEGGVIEKDRWLISAGSHVWEVDEFFGENQGLVVAEIELASEDEEFALPGWIGEDVTDDPRYYNSSLSKNPFSRW